MSAKTKGFIFGVIVGVAATHLITGRMSLPGASGKSKD